MKRMLKKLSMIGLAVALILSLCLGVAACGGPDGSGNISVFVFCGDADAATYQDMIDTWAADYAAKLKAEDPETYGSDFSITVDLRTEADTNDYYEDLNSNLSAGIAEDIIYVSPSYVQLYVTNGYVLDLTDYIDFSQYNVSDLWQEALALYAHADGTRIIDRVVYSDESNSFYVANSDGTASGTEVGMYALPKDYSSFSIAYNANFFSDAFQTAYETTPDTHGAVWVYGTTPKDGTLPTASSTAQRASGIILPGQTVTYYPFNFYRYNDLASAYNAGDPVAVMSVNNNGYDVTIPCYPTDYYSAGTDDPNTIYDDTIVYPVYTYSEYSALTFAVSYYCTVYDSGRTGTTGQVTSEQYDGADWTLASWLNDSSVHGVYGNDQYDYQGTYYLTSWLAGNGASIINDDYTSVICAEEDETTSTWGINSDKFIDAYAAFCAYGSDWNNNMYHTRSTLDSSIIGQGGFSGFTGGYEVFYGFGTWNISSFDTDKSKINNQIMATPVSDDYALNSRVKNAMYESESYGNTSKSSWSGSEIQDAMKSRQNLWGARIDSVGYGINAMAAEKYTGEYAWKMDAVADLCAYLTINEDTQVSLTYAGSQMPNYMSQCGDYITGEGSFSGIVTPEHEDWERCYAAARALAQINTDRVDGSTKIVDWLNSNGYEDIVEHVGELYQDSTLSYIDRSTSRAFRVLTMASLSTESRNLLVRMAEVNGAKDPCLYTYSNTWWRDTFATYEGSYLFNYNLDEGMYENYLANVGEIEQFQSSSKTLNNVYYYCQKLAEYGNARLQIVLQQAQQLA